MPDNPVAVKDIIMERGYIKFWRKVEDNRTWSRGLEYRGLMITLLEKANWCRGYWRGQEILPGQFAFSYAKLAESLGMDRSKLRRMLTTLEHDGFITLQSCNKVCTLLSIVNWKSYQSNTETNEHEATNRRTASDHPVNPIKEGKKAKKENSSASAAAAEPNALPSQERKRESASSKQPSEIATSSPEPEPRYLTAAKRVLTGQRLAWFNRVWDAFGYKRNKAEAADAFIGIKGLSDSLVAVICRAACQEAARRPALVARGKTPKMLTGWLIGRRWEDEADAPPPLVPVAARGPLLGDSVIDVPTQEQREEGWKAGLSFMEKWRHGVRPDNQAGQFDRRKPLPIPANFGRVLQRAL